VEVVPEEEVELEQGHMLHVHCLQVAEEAGNVRSHTLLYSCCYAHFSAPNAMCWRLLKTTITY
jgi:hypothetical protein